MNWPDWIAMLLGYAVIAACTSGCVIYALSRVLFWHLKHLRAIEAYGRFVWERGKKKGGG